MNLKEAANELGVHYQTAYKWVRAGSLRAVRIGGRYDISEAALERFEATRRAAVTLSAIDRPASTMTDLDRADVLDELEAMASDPILSWSSAAVFAARRGATVLGDCCVVTLIREDGTPGYGIIDHVEPDRTAFVGAIARSMSLIPEFEENAALVPLSTRNVLRISHVPQDRLRAALPPELHQYLPSYAVYSLMAAPLTAGGTTFGVITFLRDTPEHPYTQLDEQFAGQMATRVAWLMQSAKELREASEVRSSCVDAIRAHLARNPRCAANGVHTPDGAEFEQILATIPEASRVPIVIFDPHGRILASSQALRAFSGWSSTSVLDRNREGLCHPDDDAADRAALERLTSGEIDFLDVHARRLGSDGTYVSCASHRAAIRNEDASLLCIVSVIRKIHTLGSDAGELLGTG